MREIKFRAWDIEQKIMIPWEVMQTWSGLLRDSLNNETHITMQYTGLKDKNGKEIYEGDILSDDLLYWEVEFKPNKLYDYGEEDSTTLWGWNVEIEDIKDFEVIGNIYENPELLEAEK